MTRRRDSETADLFTPESVLPPIVPRFAPERVRAARPSGRIARAVAEAIRESEKSREEIAAEMSAYLGETVTVAMLDQYTSLANEKNNIPAHRLVAVLAVTNDIRIVNAMLCGTGFIALDAKFEALIRREILKDQLDRMKSEIAVADLQWRSHR